MFLAFLAGSRTFATVTITNATGGSNISADTAATGASPAWTPLGTIWIKEGNRSDISSGCGTLVLRAPAGFEFNTNALPTITFTAGVDITAATRVFSNATTFAVTLTMSGTSGTDTLTIGATNGTNGLEVRPTAGTPLASGQLFRPTGASGGNISINGITTTTNANGTGGSNFGTLSEAVGTASQLVFTIQPGGATTGAIFGTQPVVKTRDQFGNDSTNGLPVSRIVSLALTQGPGALLGTTGLDIGTGAGKGTVTYTDLEIDVPGANDQLTAGATGLTSGLSSIFAVNGRPTISTIPNLTTNEDRVATNSFVIEDAETAPNALILTPTSTNSTLVPVTNIVISGTGTNRTLAITPVTGLFGTSLITISVSDGVASSSTSFLLTINSVNDAPTMNALGNLTILEDTNSQTVNLSGISAGPSNESTQTLTITAFSSDTSLVPNPIVSYTSPNSTGTISFTPLTNQNGIATISVVVKDNGGTANGGVDSLTNTFTVTVQAVNDAPTLDPINDVTVNVNSGQQNVNLTGISAGPGNESQTITITATSGSSSVVPNPTIVYTSPNTTGTLRFTPATNASGNALITVTAKDNGGTNSGGQDTIIRQFTITVSPMADLAISQSAIPSPAFFGGTILFRSTVTNLGPTTATGIQVTNTLPSGIGAVSVSSSQGSSTNIGGKIITSLGSMTNGGSATININIEPLAIGSYTNVATVSGGGVPDPNLGNNSSTVVDSVVSPQFVISATSLSAETCVNGSIDPGERVTVNFSLQNNSSANTTNLVATLKVGGGVTAPSGPQTYGALVAGGAAVTRSFAFTPIGDCGSTFTATLQLQDGAASLGAISKTLNFGQLVNRTTVLANSNSISIPGAGAATPYPSTINVSGLNTNIIKLTVTLNQFSHTQPDDVDILLVGPGGQRTILMSDCGGIDVVNNIVLTFDNSASLFVSNNTNIVSGTYKPTDFEPGDSFPAPAPTSTNNPADLSIFNGTDPNGTWQLYISDDSFAQSFSGSLGSWTLNVTTVEPSCCIDNSSTDVALGMSAGPDPVVVGNNVTFTIIATNQGPATATGILVTNPFPANANFISASSSQGTTSTNGSAVVYNIGTLTNGGSAALTLTVQPLAAGLFSNSAIAYENEADHALTNNSVTGSATVVFPDVTISDTVVNEGNTGASTNAVFTLQLSSASSQTISVGYVTADITATAGSDYRATNGTVVFTPGQLTKTVSVTVLGDNLNEATEFYAVVLTNLVNVNAGNSSGLGTIIDDDPLPALSISDASVVEGNTGTTNIQFQVTLTPSSGQGVSFNFTAASGSALSGIDFVPSSGTINMIAGQTTATVSVPIIGETFNETNETFVVNLSGAVNATFSRSQAVGTIINDDFLATIGTAGAVLSSESCGPTNGVIDPNETVTVNFSLRNISAGTASTTNLVATLLQVGGITAPGASQTYGALTAGSAPVSKPFTFVANGICGDTLMAVLQLQDGANNLGMVTNFLTTGKAGSVTNTFSNLNSIPISDFGPATPYPSTISVAGVGNVTKLTVTLFGLSHTYPSDLEMLLVGPGGQSVILMSDAGDGLPVNNVNLSLDDAAASLVPSGTQIVSGTYKPTDYPPDDIMPDPAPAGVYGTNLSVFNNTNPNGVWSLYIADDSSGDGGQLAGGWRLTMTTLAPPVCCGANSLADLSIGLSGSAGSVLLGSNITYTASVTNLGPNTASDVTLNDVLPPNLTFVSANSSIGTCTNINGTVVCNLGTMTNTARATVTIVATGTVAGYATNAATVSSRAADNNLANSSASVITAIVPPGPLASFSANPTSGTKPLNVTFFDTSLGTITNRLWNFGNGVTTNTAATNFPFTYPIPGTNSVTLTVTGPGGTNSLTLTNYIVVTNPPPQLVVSPLSLGFGLLLAGQTTTQSFQVVNAGGLPLTGNVTVPAPFAIQSGSSLNLTPGQTGAVAVAFSPVSAGSFSNAVIFTSNGGNSTNTVTGSGYIPPSFAVSPANLSFGTVAVGTNAQLNFAATNSGSIPITNATVSISAGPFSIISSLAFQVPGFTSTNITVRFTPAGEGSFSNTVFFSSEISSGTNLVFGTGAIVPVANFTGTPTTGLKPLTVTFTDNSTGTITNRFWNFGDGSTTNTSLTNFTHFYATAGTNTVSLTVSGPVGTNVQTRSNYIQSTNLPPQLVLNPTSLSFGQLIIGQASTQTFQVINLGDLTLTGSVSTLQPFSIQSGSPFAIAGGQTGTVSVAYVPTSSGTFSNVATFISNGGNSTNSLMGSAITPGLLSVSPTNLNFGTVAVGSSPQTTFTLTNLGAAPLTNGTAVVTGGPFSIISGTPFTLPGFGSTNLVVSFTPTGASNYSNSIIFTANAASRTNPITGTGAFIPVASFAGNPTNGTRPLTVTFTDNSTGTITNRFWNFGDGTTTNTPATNFTHLYATAGTNSVSLTVTGPVGTNTVSLPGYIVATNPPPLLTITPASLNFGQVIISQSTTQNFQIVNNGGLTLTGSVSATLPFTVQTNSYNLAPGQTGLVAVSFSPVSAGSFSNAVVFISNGGNSTNTVTGVGLTPSQLGVSPATLNFGTVAVGSNFQTSFVLTNQGGATLSNGTATITAGPFSIISGTPFTLAGFGSTNLVMRFTPVSAGSFTNLVTFNNPSDGTTTNTVIGTGAIVPVASFTGTPTNGFVPLTVTFTDNSTGTITNRAWDFGDGSTTNISATQITHVYSSARTNRVILAVTGPVGSNSLTRSNYITVTNLPPQLVVNPTNLNFGPIQVSQSITQIFQITNAGQLTLTGSVSVPLPFAIRGGSPFNLAGGQTGAVQVSFSPTNVGNFSNAVVFISNGGNRTNAVTGSGFTPAQLTVSPSTLDFGNVAVGTNAQASFTLTNSGSAPLTNGTISIGAGSFSIVSPTNFTIAGFGGTNIVASFTPADAGSITNVVTFSSDGGNRTNQVIGTGAFSPVAIFQGSPTIGLKPLNVTFTDTSTGTITNRFWNFGDGSTSNSTATTVSHLYANAGTNDVTLTVIGPVGTNSLVRSQYVTVTNLPPQLVLNPTNIDFGATILGQTNVRNIQVINNGGTTLDGTAIVEAPFGILSGTPYSVAPGQTGLVAVSFSPTIVGSFSNAVVFLSSGGNSTNALIGTGAIIPVANFSGTPTSGFVPLTVTFTDLSTGTITNRAWDFGDGSTTNVLGTEVIHFYSAPGTNSVVLSVTGPVGSNSLTQAAYIVVTNLPPQLVVTPTNLDFGSVFLDDTNFLNVQVINTGQLLLSGTVTAEPPFSIQAGANYSVNPGQTSLVTVAFGPTNAGAISNALIFVSNGGNATNALTGIGVTPPQLTVRPFVIDFGLVDVDIGQNVQASFIVTNRGVDPLTNVQVFVDGGPFSIVSSAAFDLPGLSSSNLTVNFAPSQAGIYSNLVIAVSDFATSTNTVTGIAASEPHALFVGSPTTGFNPLTVTFSDNSTGTITNRFWDFGDGASTNTLLTNITHLYPTAGTNTVSLMVSGPLGISVLTQTNFIQITNLPPQLVVAPTNLNFGTVLAGATATKSFQITNAGGLPLAGAAAVGLPFAIQSGGTFNLAPGETGTVVVSFSPFKADTYSNLVIFTSNGGSTTNALTGIALRAPQLQVSPQNLDLGTIIVGNNVQSSFVATNQGAGLITNVSVLVGDGPFSVQSVANFALNAFSATNVLIQFTPANQGNFSNLIAFVTSNGPSRTNSVTGVAIQVPVADFTANPTSGLKPLLVSFTDNSTGTITNRFWDFGDGSTSNTLATTVEHIYSNPGTNTVLLAASGPAGISLFTKTNYIVVTNLPPQIALAPTNLDFGSIIIGQTATQTVQLANLGGETLSGTVSATPPFSIDGGSPYAIAPGQTGQISVIFSPNQGASFSNSLVFLSNGGNTTNPVVGVGLTPASLAVIPGSLDFGLVDINAGTNAFGTLIITNLGGAPLTGGTAVVSGGPFSIVSGSPFTLPGFGSTNLVISFAPTNAGSSSNAVMFSSSGGNATNALTGVAAFEPQASFVAVPTNGLKPLLVTFTDTSAGTVTNRTWFFGDGSLTNTSATSVSHVYAQAGSYSVSLTASGPVGNSSQMIFDYIVVTNLPPSLSIAPPSLNFGQVITGQTNLLNFQVVNTGGSLLSGFAAASPPFAIENSATYNVDPGSTGLVSVSFSPTSAGTFSNSVVFVSNGGTNTNTVTGIGLTPPQLLVSPASRDFGTIAVGSNTQATFTLTNTGGATLSNGIAALSAGAFTIVSGTPFTLPGFGTTNLIVLFTPGSAGNFSNAVLITSSNGGNSTNTVTGTGAIVPTATFAGSPTIGLNPLTVTFTDNSTGTITNRFWNFGDGITTNTTVTNLTHIYTNASTNTVILTVSGPVGTNTFTRNNYIAVTNLPPQLVVNPTSLVFDPTVVGQTNVLTFQITNSGGINLTGTVSATLPFSIQSGSPYTLTPGQGGTVSVRFVPSSAGTSSNNVIFISNGGNRTNSVTGIGLTPAQLAVLPSSLNFGVVPVGSNSQASLLLTNTGGAAISSGSASVTGGPFSVVSGSPFTLSGFGTTNLVLNFTPPAEGIFSNAVIVTTGNDGTVTNSLIGAGAVLPVASFAGNPLTGVRPLNVVFSDTSSGTITNRAWDFGDGATTNTTATNLSHLYQNAGTYGVTLAVSGPVGSNILTQANYIVVSNLPPQLAVNPTNLNFGSQVIGQTSTQLVQVINAGELPLIGTVSASVPFAIQDGGSFNVSPAQTGLVAVTFSPPSAGSFSNVIVFLSNGGNSSNTVSGIGLTPANLSVSPGTIDFGTVAVGASSQASFIVTNSGQAILSNGLANISPGAFAIVSGSPFSLPGSGSTNLVVQFTPGSVGSFSNLVVISSGNDGGSTNVVLGTGAAVPIANFIGSPTSGVKPLVVTFTDNSTGTITNRLWDFGDGSISNTTATTVSHIYNDTGTNTVNLTVTGPVGANTSIRGSYVIVTNPPPQLVVSPTNLNFGSLVLGQSSTQTFQILNNGGLNLSGTATVSPPFGIIGNAAYNVAPGQSAPLSIRFTPVSAGVFSNAVVFTSNGGSSSNFVSGTALTPPQLSVLSDSVEFGTVAVGDSITVSLILTNFGGGFLTNGVASVSGPGPFSIVSGTPFNLPGFGYTNLVVKFAPSVEGVFSNAVVLSSGNDGTDSVSLYGTGAVEPTANFIADRTTGLKPLLVNFTDNSTGTITNRLWDFGDGSTTTTTATSVNHTFVNAGTNSVSLTVMGPVGTKTISRPDYIIVTNLPPQLFLSATNINFGQIPFGQSSTQTVQIVNNGGLTLTGNVSVSSPFAIRAGSSYLLAPGQTGSVDVSFTAVGGGGFSNMLSFTGNGGNPLVPVFGFGLTPPQLSVSPTTWDFGTVSVGATVQGSFFVTNLGSLPINSGTASPAGGPFGIVSGSSFSVPGLGSTNIIVRFSPLKSGSFSNVIVFTTPDAGTSTNGVTGVSTFAPVADFSATPVNGSKPLLVTFNDRSTGSVTNWSWDFGDGVTTNSTTAGMTHTYTAAGNYTVMLTVAGSLGTNTRTYSNLIVVTEGLFITRIVRSGSDVLVSFNSKVGQFYRLEYTDSLLLPNWQTAVSFVAGTGSIVTATHLGGAGQPSRFYRVKQVDSALAIPVADFNGNPRFGVTPLKVTFVDNSAGFITNRSWNFGDGSTTNTTASVVTHTYAVAGTNTVSLTVSGPLGTNTMSRANFISTIDYLLITSLQSVASNVLVSFTSRAGEFYRLEYTDDLSIPVWKTAVDFVPGTGDIVSAIHLGGFTQSARFYRIHLLSAGQVAPAADFIANLTFGSAPLTVVFTDTSSGYVTNRLWDFGDGASTNSTETTVSHTYNSPGTNTVTLTVTGPLGSSLTVRNNLIIVAARQLFISQMAIVSSDVVISFGSETGKLYRIEYTDDLNLPWNIAVNAIPGTGDIISVTHVGGAGAASRFYRLREL